MYSFLMMLADDELEFGVLQLAKLQALYRPVPKDGNANSIPLSCCSLTSNSEKLFVKHQQS